MVSALSYMIKMIVRVMRTGKIVCRSLLYFANKEGNESQTGKGLVFHGNSFIQSGMKAGVCVSVIPYFLLDAVHTGVSNLMSLYQVQYLTDLKKC